MKMLCFYLQAYLIDVEFYLWNARPYQTNAEKNEYLSDNYS